MAPRPASDRPARRTRRNRAALVSLAAAGALLATACGGGDGGGGGTADGDTVTLRMSWWGSDTRHAYTQEIIDKFEAENPDIRVEPDYTGWDDYWDRLATSAAGRQAPDIMQQDARYVREYADRGALLGLDEYLGDTIRDDALDEAVTPMGEVDGTTYAIPTGINAFSIVADPAAYEAAGVELPDDDSWTWDDFIETARGITEGSDGEVYGTQNLNYTETGFQIFARQRGEALYDEDGGPGFSEETLREWWNLVIRMREEGAEPPPSVSVETQAGGIDQSLLSTNKGAMGGWWTNELPALTANSGRELELLRFPGETAGQQAGMYLKPAMFWAVSARSEHPEAAARLVDFLINEEASVGTALSDRGLPVNLELREQILPELQPADQKSAQFLERITPELAEPPALPPVGAGEVEQILQRLNEQVLFDQISVDQAVEQFMSGIETATS